MALDIRLNYQDNGSTCFKSWDHPIYILFEMPYWPLRGFAPNKLLILPTARIQNKCECRLTLMNSF